MENYLMFEWHKKTFELVAGSSDALWANRKSKYIAICLLLTSQVGSLDFESYPLTCVLILFAC